MAISLVGTPTTKGSSGTTMSVPSGLQENDVVFVMLFSDWNTTPQAPTGFEVGQTGRGGSSAVDFGWFYKVMGATPITEVELTYTYAQYTCGICFAVRGVDPSNVLDVSIPTKTTGSSGMPNAPAITPETNGAMILAMGFLDDDIVSSPSAPSGFTMIKSHYESNGSNYSTAMVAYKLWENTGEVDPGAFGGSGSDDWVGCTCALRPYVETVNNVIGMGCAF